MPDYEHSTTIDGKPDAVFDYLADIDNLPSYFDRMTSARRGDEPGTVQVTAQIDRGNGPEEVEGEARFEVDREQRRITWSSEGPNDYHGWLEVREDGPGVEVVVHLTTQRVASGEIDRGIDETLSSIKAQ